MTLEEIQAEYKDSFLVSESEKGWVNVKSKKPLYDNHPATGGPAFLDYSIDKNDHRDSSLEDRSRNVWLRDKNGKGFTSVSYCGGMGIWQVSEDGKPMAYSDLSRREQEMVKGWLKDMDNYVFKSMPKLKEYLK